MLCPPITTAATNVTERGMSETFVATKKVRILSIDGGGIRGIIPATILAYVEDKIQQMTDNPEARLCDYFDFLAGTSTGGILTCAYLCPHADTGRPMSAAAALKLYTEHGDEIFALSKARKWRTLFGLFDEKYSITAIERLLKANFGEQTRMKDMLKPCLITSYDIQRRKALFFDQLGARKKKEKNFKVWEVARSTAAAPTYFEPANIQCEMGSDTPLIDGGLFANNPAMCAYIDAHKTRFSTIDPDRAMPDHPLCSDMFMLSISTGAVKQAYPYKKMKDKGKLSWIKPIIDIMMSASSETVDYQLQQVFNTCQKLQGDQAKNNYLRLRPELGTADPAMDNVSAKNLKALHQAGLDYIDENRATLDQLVKRLIEE